MRTPKHPVTVKFFCPALNRFVASGEFHLCYYFIEDRHDKLAGNLTAFYQQTQPNSDELTKLPVTIVPFTGFTDGNHKPIFHGDILTECLVRPPLARKAIAIEKQFFHLDDDCLYWHDITTITGKFRITGSAFLTPNEIPIQSLKALFTFNQD